MFIAMSSYKVYLSISETSRKGEWEENVLGREVCKRRESWVWRLVLTICILSFIRFISIRSCKVGRVETHACRTRCNPWNRTLDRHQPWKHRKRPWDVQEVVETLRERWDNLVPSLLDAILRLEIVPPSVDEWEQLEDHCCRGKRFC